ncbi:hypothetical protein Afil01_68980 [Actinorhabdospora filicis]|uniref:Uncharacterized protein n=1 Tax=Actinorhabdospora filicis TaxID=1785913 RepID=A0A9W6SWN0_9ACTN|nr:hypothetical protein [Actinorhabdospora filicis]GLZ82091.1 hypothetical protein Afil01_68980 [Actinorhabdospora filicis]
MNDTSPWTAPDAPAAPRPPAYPPQAPAPVSWGGQAPRGRIGATSWAEPLPRSYAPVPQRPRYREALRITPGGIWSGAAVACGWFLISGLLATTLSAYVWVTAVAALVAWLAASLLARYGDRGAAAGVAVVTGMALGIAGLVVEVNAVGGDWILW